jgi:AcrR family transcriptional regulator
VEPSTIVARFGGKHGIYHAVMARVASDERAYLQAALAEFTPDLDGLTRLAVHYLDYCVAHPELPALWMHRALSDASDLVELEDLYAAPLLQMVTDAVREAVGDDVDADMLVWSVIWCVHSFSRAGLLCADGERLHPQDPRALARFRSYVRLVLANLPTAEPTAEASAVG